MVEELENRTIYLLQKFSRSPKKPPQKKMNLSLQKIPLPEIIRSTSMPLEVPEIQQKTIGNDIIPKLGMFELENINKVSLEGMAIETNKSVWKSIPSKDARWIKFLCAIIGTKGKLPMFEGELTPDYLNMMGSLIYKYCGRRSEARDLDIAHGKKTLYSCLTTEIKNAWKAAEGFNDHKRETYLENFLDYYNAKIRRMAKEKKLEKEASSSRLKKQT